MNQDEKDDFINRLNAQREAYEQWVYEALKLFLCATNGKNLENNMRSFAKNAAINAFGPPIDDIKETPEIDSTKKLEGNKEPAQIPAPEA